MKFENLSGMKFNRWTVLDEHKRQGKCTVWLCECECGTRRFVKSSSLKYGQSRSCGCLAVDTNSRHGGRRDRLYNVWVGMKKRCYSPNSISFRLYGGRGITVCPEWKSNYAAFRNWALDNGYDETAPRGKCTLDRIDNDGNYEPSNCQWVDSKTQGRNRRTNHLIEYKGKTYTLMELSELTGISYSTLQTRIRKGCSDEQIAKYAAEIRELMCGEGESDET